MGNVRAIVNSALASRYVSPQIRKPRPRAISPELSRAGRRRYRLMSSLCGASVATLQNETLTMKQCQLLLSRMFCCCLHYWIGVVRCTGSGWVLDALLHYKTSSSSSAHSFPARRSQGMHAPWPVHVL